mgnify:CR=1 FL=1
MKFSNRMKQLQTSIFNRLNEEKANLLAQGQEIYDFTIGSPNIAPSKEIQNALIEAAKIQYVICIHYMTRWNFVKQYVTGMRNVMM